MFGDDKQSSGLGIIPSAISWLFRLITEQKERTGARFSVRISAVEVYGKEEALRDLLSSVSNSKLTDSIYIYILKRTKNYLLFLC